MNLNCIQMCKDWELLLCNNKHECAATLLSDSLVAPVFLDDPIFEWILSLLTLENIVYKFIVSSFLFRQTEKCSTLATILLFWCLTKDVQVTATIETLQALTYVNILGVLAVKKNWFPWSSSSCRMFSDLLPSLSETICATEQHIHSYRESFFPRLVCNFSLWFKINVEVKNPLLLV